MGRLGLLLLTASAVLAALYAWHRHRSDHGAGATVLVVPASSASTGVALHRHALPRSDPIRTNDPTRQEGADKDAPQRVFRDVTALLAAAPDLQYLHRRLLAEGRDEAWASRAEAMLNTSYRGFAGFEEADASFDIHCGTTLCEVYVDPAARDGTAAGPLMDHIQSADLAADLWRRGYRNMGAAYGPGDPGHETNVTYYQREAPVTILTRPSP